MEYLEIREFGEIITGKTPKTDVLEYWGGDTPFITPTDIPSFDTKYLHSTERTISELGVTKQKNTLLPADTLCVSCIATIGKMCLTRKPSVTNQQINSIKVNDRFNPHYLLYLFRYYLPYLQLIGGGTGSGTPIISKGKFSKLKYPVHQDLEIQNKIAEFLSTYDELIENNNKRIKLLEHMAENLYKEWFVRFHFPNHENTEFENGIPVGWERTTFDKIASFQNGYAFKSEELLGSSEDDTYEVFKQGHIMRGGGFKAEGTKSWYPKSKCADLNKFILHKNDILMAMTDMKDNVAILGNTALLPHDNRYILNQRVGLLRPTNYRKVGFAYIYLLTNSYDFVNDLRSRANHGVQVNLSVAQIRSSATVVPSEEINEKFEQIINPIFEEVFNILNQNENLIKQRDLLLPRLMSGKLEV